MKNLTAVSKLSPVWLAAFWAVIFFAGFVYLIPQPAVIIGYIWKGEFALAALILLTILCALSFKEKERSNLARFSGDEINFIILPLALFTVWSGFSCFWAQSTRGAIHHTLLWACYLLFYVLMRQVVSSARLLNISFISTGVVVSILGSLCAIEYFTTASEFSVNVSLHYSKYAEALAALVPIFTALAIRRKNRRPFFTAIASILGWLGVVCSLGRTQFLAALVGVFVLAFLIIFFCLEKVSMRRGAIVFGTLVLLTALTQIGAFTGGTQQTTIKRFSGDPKNRASYDTRKLYWNLAVQDFKENPVFGVGADNFVTAYGRAREDFSSRDTENPLLETDENVLSERAHNEFLQIPAELGAVGAILFAWFLFGILKFGVRIRRGGKQMLLASGALAGIASFFVSSLASSYSFRVAANGACFFFLLALAARCLSKPESEPADITGEKIFNFKPIFAVAGLVVCTAMLIFSGFRAASLMYLQNGLSATEASESEASFRTASALDDGDPLIKYCDGVRLYNEARSVEAIPRLRLAIDKGVATSLAYFYLAAAQIQAQKTADAEATLRESLRVYPRSVFLLTFYADFLRANKRDAEAEAQFDKALKVNAPQAESWRKAIAEGTPALNKETDREKYVEVMDMQPKQAIYALLDFHRQNNPNLLPKEAR